VISNPGRGINNVTDKVEPRFFLWNSRVTMTFNAAGELQTIVKDEPGGAVYTKTFTWTNGNPTGISAWVET